MSGEQPVEQQIEGDAKGGEKADSAESKNSRGTIIRHSGWTRRADFNELAKATNALEVDVVVVLGSEELYTQLHNDLPNFVKIIHHPRYTQPQPSQPRNQKKSSGGPKKSLRKRFAKGKRSNLDASFEGLTTEDSYEDLWIASNKSLIRGYYSTFARIWSQDLIIKRAQLFLLPLCMPKMNKAKRAMLRLSGKMGPVYEAVILLRLETGSGLIGVGGSTLYTEGGIDQSPLHSLKTMVTQIVGTNIGDWSATYNRLSHQFSNCSPQTESILDIAVWDMLAQSHNVPLFHFLGGHESSLAAYLSFPTFATMQEAFENTDKYVEKGFTAFKYHTWGTLKLDMEFMKQVAERYAENPVLKFVFDFEQQYSVEEAELIVSNLKSPNFLWFEALIDDTDMDGYAILSGLTDTPLLPAGFIVQRPKLLQMGLRKKSWGAIRVDVTKCGGITAVKRIHNLARGYGVPIELQSWGHQLTQAANLHTMLGLQCGNYHELPHPSERFVDYVSHGMYVHMGKIMTPDAPGLGLQVDWPAVRKNALVIFDYRAGSTKPSFELESSKPPELSREISGETSLLARSRTLGAAPRFRRFDYG